MAGISCRDMTKIYPCLICLDNSVSVPYVGLYFDEQFRAVFPRNKFRQTVTLNISDVENVLGYLEEFKLSDILDSFYSRNRNMLGSLSTSEVPLLKTAQPALNIVREGFADFGRRIERDLFPGQAE